MKEMTHIGERQQAQKQDYKVEIPPPTMVTSFRFQRSLKFELRCCDFIVGNRYDNDPGRTRDKNRRHQESKAIDC